MHVKTFQYIWIKLCYHWTVGLSLLHIFENVNKSTLNITLSYEIVTMKEGYVLLVLSIDVVYSRTYVLYWCLPQQLPLQTFVLLIAYAYVISVPLGTFTFWPWGISSYSCCQVAFHQLPTLLATYFRCVNKCQQKLLDQSGGNS